ncbi:chromosome segregation in meiosis- protein [Maudiozyma exigua]|uniref:Chromosome segregation in meiosis- protein n=1 Tax=Maudiozyma exigua TaxID=34358 RepID=A0A9P6WD26_MAUEX|nr:chromosome segregation in meiosis- protein [Kazachstania exigua]
MQRYDDLPNLLLWKSFNKKTLAKGLHDFIITNSNVNTTKGTETNIVNNITMNKLYYIDSVNSFPLEEFQKMVPITIPTNKKIYDNVIINQALILRELTDILMKIMHSEQEQVSEKVLDVPLPSSHKVLVIINGMDIMYQNSSMSDTKQAHYQLNTGLLRLRQCSNSSSGLFKAVILSRDLLNNSTRSFNSQKRSRYEGNSIYQFIAKFYADYSI